MRTETTMTEPVLEASYDYELAKTLGCSVDTVRLERREGYVTLQKRMRARGHNVPDDLTEFAAWCRETVRHG
jgi:hypothetical protein